MRELHYCLSCHESFFKTKYNDGFCSKCHGPYYASFTLESCLDAVAKEILGVFLEDGRISVLNLMLDIFKKLVREKKRFERRIGFCTNCSFSTADPKYDVGFYARFDASLKNCPQCSGDVMYFSVKKVIDILLDYIINKDSLFKKYVYMDLKRVNVILKELLLEE